MYCYIFFFDNLQFIAKNTIQFRKSSLHTANKSGGRLSLLKQKDILESKAALAVWCAAPLQDLGTQMKEKETNIVTLEQRKTEAILWSAADCTFQKGLCRHLIALGFFYLGENLTEIQYFRQESRRNYGAHKETGKYSDELPIRVKYTNSQW